jgi:hypothetical protein
MSSSLTARCIRTKINLVSAVRDEWDFPLDEQQVVESGGHHATSGERRPVASLPSARAESDHAPCHQLGSPHLRRDLVATSRSMANQPGRPVAGASR